MRIPGGASKLRGLGGVFADLPRNAVAFARLVMLTTLPFSPIVGDVELSAVQETLSLTVAKEFTVSLDLLPKLFLL
jgi:hypothetical protein